MLNELTVVKLILAIESFVGKSKSLYNPLSVNVLKLNDPTPYVPVGPVHPVGPLGPVDPDGPVCPVTPDIPVIPVQPVGPVCPVVPVGPV